MLRAVLLLVIVTICKGSYPKDSYLRMNQLQMKGTHNSYAFPNVIAVIPHPKLRYAHTKIPNQLVHGARSIELDVFFQSDGKRYFVYHDPNLAGTLCVRLSDCLREVDKFSNAFPTHHWIHHLIEVKTFKGWTQQQVVQTLEREYIAAFGLSRLIQVSDLRRNTSSLRQGVKEFGWPTLGESRGKHMLTIQFAEGDQEATPQDRARLNDIYNTTSTVAFGFARPVSQNESWAVVVQMFRDVVRDEPWIVSNLLNENVILRSRSDADLKQFEFREVMLASGVQIVSTDFAYACEDTDFFVEFPDGTPSRCNLVTAPSGCSPADIEVGITSFEMGRDAPGDEWCCSNPVFYWSTMLISALMFVVAGAFVIIYVGCCRCKHGGPRGGPTVVSMIVLMILTNVLDVGLTRAVTDVFIQRFSIIPDDFFNSLIAVVRSVYVSIAIVYLYTMHDSGLSSSKERLISLVKSKNGEVEWLAHCGIVNFIVTTPLLAFIGVVVSVSGKYDQSYGYGVWRNDGAYGSMAIVSVVCSVWAVFGFFAAHSVMRDNAVYASILALVNAPLVLLLALIDLGDALVPLRTMLVSMPGTKVVAWHALLSSVCLCAICITIVVRWYHRVDSHVGSTRMEMTTK